MQLLLDENTDPRLADVLRPLGHSVDHIESMGMAGADDATVVARAAEYDAFVTIDLHRQTREWIAVNEAMLGTVRVVRMRFRGSELGDLLDQARMLLSRWRDLEHQLTLTDTRLITLSGVGSQLRVTTADEVRAMLSDRTK